MAAILKPRDPAFKPPARIAARDFSRMMMLCSEPKRASEEVRARLAEARRHIKDSGQD